MWTQWETRRATRCASYVYMCVRVQPAGAVQPAGWGLGKRRGNQQHCNRCAAALPAAPAMQEKLSQRFPGLAFTVCPKADAMYPIVSAASIVAKVTRDRLLRGFQHPESVAVAPTYGSGYPGERREDGVQAPWHSCALASQRAEADLPCYPANSAVT